MYLQRPGEPAGRGRFWLALSLSTVTAAAVAAPLALKAVNFENEGPPAAPLGEDSPADEPSAPESIDLPDIGQSRDGQGNIGPAPEPEVDPTVPRSDPPQPTTTATTEAPTTTTPSVTEPPTTEPETTTSVDTGSSTSTTDDTVEETTTTEAGADVGDAETTDVKG